MRCGDVETCAAIHQAPALGMHCTKTAGKNKRPVQWGGGRCLLCGRENKLSMAIKSGRLVYCCHYSPSCTADGQAKIRAAVADLLPDCITIRRPKPETFTREDFAALLGLSYAAMQLRAACIAWDMTPAQAAGRLGMSRSSFYRAISEVPDLGRNGRSP